MLLVGHNPGLHELGDAARAAGSRRTFPTGALAELRLDVDDWKDLQPGGAELVQLVVPRELAG